MRTGVPHLAPVFPLCPPPPFSAVVSVCFFGCLPHRPPPHHPHPLCSPPCPSQPVPLPPPPCWLPGWPHLASALSLCPHASTLCPWSEPDVRQGLAGVHGRTGRTLPGRGRRRSSASRSPSGGRPLSLSLSPCQPRRGRCLVAALPVSGAAGCRLLAFSFSSGDHQPGKQHPLLPGNPTEETTQHLVSAVRHWTSHTASLILSSV